MSNILSVHQVSKTFANHVALNLVNMEVPAGSIFGLLGPNGAGKTTLIRIINQITGPDSGEIHFNGEKLNPQHIERIGYLPEERGLYKKMAVGDQALYLAQLKGLSKAEANKRLKYWFEKLEMQTWWKKKVEDLSKGMQQKVQFVITILHQPQLLILDEPFSGFDPINANIIKNELLELQKQGTTIIFSTHNMGSVEELCDHIALINKSQVVLNGSVKEIRQKHKSNVYDLEFTGNIISFTNAMWAGAELISHSNDGLQCKARVKLLHGNTPNNLLKALLPAIEINMLKEVVPSMNDIFISTVGDSNALGTQSNYTE